MVVKGSRCGRGWDGLAPPTFQVVSGKIWGYGAKTVCQILTVSFLPAIFCQTVYVWLSAKLQPLPLLKNTESPVDMNVGVWVWDVRVIFSSRPPTQDCTTI